MKEILDNYQIRKTNKQKTEFINYVSNRLSRNDYCDDDIHVEERWKGLLKTRNIVVGNPDKADIIVTAHYDTPPVAPLPNYMFPTNFVLFWLYQIIFCFIIFFSAWVITIPVALLNVSGQFYMNVCQAVLIGIVLWFLFGYQNKHNANDNTSGVITLIKILENIPKNKRDKICVVFFDNEEKGLLGSLYFKKLHKEAQHKLLVNFDCVGDGDRIVTLVRKKAKKSEQYENLTKIFLDKAPQYELKYLRKKEKFMMFGSDQVHFKTAVGVCALRKSIFGFLYAARLHTPFDTKCQEKNLDFLSNVIIDFIGG
jgi:hypothetical protein